MNRPRQTLVDYLVIAIAPALIMLLVGSLTFFLIDVFYDGQFVARLKMVTALFVFAAVLIGRIAAEEGSEYARLFSVPLAAATFLALIRFVDAGIVLNLVLIGLTWWCAHKLTLDCTVVDDRRRASGQGLLQTLGLDGAPVAEERTNPQSKERSRAVGDLASDDSESRNVGVEKDGLPDDERSIKAQIRAWFKNRRKHHAPGVTIVYFAAASLPLFGLGQLLTDPIHRGSAFRQLFVYVASAMALLMTTSFLQLRRYLRQRRIDMPIEMTATWLAVGSVMIVAIMVAALLLPRPEPGQSLTQAVGSLGSSLTRRSSRLNVGPEGVHDEDANQSDQTSIDPDARNQVATKNANEKGGGDGKPEGGETSDRQGNSSSHESDSNKTDSNETASNGTDSDEAGEDGTDNNESDRSRKSQQGEDQSNSEGGNDEEQPPQSERDNESRERDQNRDGSSGEQPRQQRKDETQSRSSDRTPEEKRPNDRRTDSPPPPQSSPTTPRFPNLLANIPRLLYWIVIGCGLAFLFWKYRSEIAVAVAQFVRDLRRLWARLFGRANEDVEDAVEEDIDEPLPLKPFSAYRNPFANGKASQYSIAELIRYSFEALEAWARDHQCPRSDDQTPAEFARQVGARHKRVANPARQLAALYGQLAYSSQAVPKTASGPLEELWKVLTNP